MSAFETCPSCGGFLPHAAAAHCPHCDAHVEVKKVSFAESQVAKRIARGLLAMTSGSVLAVTLMACYGAPDCDAGEDLDGDGWRTEACWEGGLVDCEDDKPEINPGADDPEGDGLDQNCDGVDGVAEPPDTDLDDAGVGDDDAGTTGGDAGSEDNDAGA